MLYINFSSLLWESPSSLQVNLRTLSTFDCFQPVGAEAYISLQSQGSLFIYMDITRGQQSESGP